MSPCTVKFWIGFALRGRFALRYRGRGFSLPEQQTTNRRFYCSRGTSQARSQVSCTLATFFFSLDLPAVTSLWLRFFPLLAPLALHKTSKMPPSAIEYANGAYIEALPPPGPLCQIVTPVGMMGYGFSEEQVETALEKFSHRPTPTALVLDSGSTDSGPSKLALGSTTCPRSSYVRDFRKLLGLAQRYHIPILISSAGGDGSDEHVDLFLEIIREILEESSNM